MKKLNIIIVGYNEEMNLNKLFFSLEYIKTQIEVQDIYIDQMSNDYSLNIAKNYTKNTYLHENKGYCEPDKKWAYDTLCNNGEWCLFLDADEELTKEVSNELIEIVNSNQYDAYEFIIEIKFLDIVVSKSKQLRLVKKGKVKVTDTVHNRINKGDANIGFLKNKIINRNLKEVGKDRHEISIWTDKMNRYTDKEIESLLRLNLSSFQLMVRMFSLPIIHFFGFLFKNGLMKYGIRGIIYSFLAGFYQFVIYSKLYEHNYKKNL